MPLQRGWGQVGRGPCVELCRQGVGCPGSVCCREWGCTPGVHTSLSLFLSLPLSLSDPIMLLAGSGKTCKSGFGWVPGLGLCLWGSMMGAIGVAPVQEGGSVSRDSCSARQFTRAACGSSGCQPCAPCTARTTRSSSALLRCQQLPVSLGSGTHGDTCAVCFCSLPSSPAPSSRGCSPWAPCMALWLVVQAQSRQRSAWQSLLHPEFVLQPSLDCSSAGSVPCDPLGLVWGWRPTVPVLRPHVLLPTGTSPTCGGCTRL